MARCEICGNDYDKAFQVVMPGDAPRWYDSFECAIHAHAPRCSHCSCRVLGHGVEQAGRIFCGAHCAAQEGSGELVDRA